MCHVTFLVACSAQRSRSGLVAPGFTRRLAVEPPISTGGLPSARALKIGFSDSSIGFGRKILKLAPKTFRPAALGAGSDRETRSLLQDNESVQR